jgi:hypothetical protein
MRFSYFVVIFIMQKIKIMISQNAEVLLIIKIVLRFISIYVGA